MKKMILLMAAVITFATAQAQTRGPWHDKTPTEQTQRRQTRPTSSPQKVKSPGKSGKTRVHSRAPHRKPAVHPSRSTHNRRADRAVHRNCDRDDKKRQKCGNRDD